MTLRTLCLGAAGIAIATAAIAGGHSGNPAVKARKAHMQLYAHNLGILGAMAKGEAEYNADAAMAAANNLVGMTQISQGTYWVPGTSSDDLEESRALPALWESGSEAQQIGMQLGEAVQALAAVAGDGQEAIGPALGPVGKACGACHDDYRKSNN